MGYINQVQKGQEVTDIQDIRMPNITNADIGKYLKVKDDLSLEFAEVGGGSGTVVVDLGGIVFTSNRYYFTPTAEQYATIKNNDNVVVKFRDITDSESDGGYEYYMTKSCDQRDGDTPDEGQIYLNLWYTNSTDPEAYIANVNKSGSSYDGIILKQDLKEVFSGGSGVDYLTIDLSQYTPTEIQSGLYKIDVTEAIYNKAMTDGTIVKLIDGYYEFYMPQACKNVSDLNVTFNAFVPYNWEAIQVTTVLIGNMGGEYVCLYKMGYNIG